ncbi:hypothetical protein NA78x_003808 [Anatilimnocola sp. NA78]|uniref:hypothetical protein n=1 Tax=Anatilimnocola sp. NA78 TaxID=3415683 RepID=UPI003CE479CF
MKPTFVEQLQAADGFPRGLSSKNHVSWIIARLTELSAGGLMFDNTHFESDGGEFGYRLKIFGADGKLLGYWGIIFWPDRIRLMGHSTSDLDGQTLIVEMLTESPAELGKCEVTIRNPDARTKKTFGWNGYQFV